MRATRMTPALPEHFTNIQIYVNLSQTTLANRKAFATVIRALRNINIIFKWGYPNKLIVQRNGTEHSISTPEDVEKYLKEWRLEAENQMKTPNRREPATSPKKLNPDWKTTATVSDSKGENPLLA
ncbi:Hypothetical predicted protein [Pelobates cultripes]|uniref:Uncharacterized protein n=1 Tax=Pelobates cultripes TaxID=61616 RepID=A0AAD1SZV2_PELCU|nr:Hypothetical predicted protein [Pelobates cultripes]